MITILKKLWSSLKQSSWNKVEDLDVVVVEKSMSFEEDTVE
jgi:hypothetical protein